MSLITDVSSAAEDSSWWRIVFGRFEGVVRFFDQPRGAEPFSRAWADTVLFDQTLTQTASMVRKSLLLYPLRKVVVHRAESPQNSQGDASGDPGSL